jgi:hypothetical protein
MGTSDSANAEPAVNGLIRKINKICVDRVFDNRGEVFSEGKNVTISRVKNLRNL